MKQQRSRYRKCRDRCRDCLNRIQSAHANKKKPLIKINRIFRVRIFPCHVKCCRNSWHKVACLRGTQLVNIEFHNIIDISIHQRIGEGSDLQQYLQRGGWGCRLRYYGDWWSCLDLIETLHVSSCIAHSKIIWWRDALLKLIRRLIMQYEGFVPAICIGREAPRRFTSRARYHRHINLLHVTLYYTKLKMKRRYLKVGKQYAALPVNVNVYARHSCV